MWVAQFYKFKSPRTWLSSSGLGTMGFGLPAAMGAQTAHPDATVVDIDGDGSFQMNIQELATCHCEELPVKVLLLNNQHLGMVVQWEDRFMAGNRAHTYSGPNPPRRGDRQWPKDLRGRAVSRFRHDCQGLRLRWGTRQQESGPRRGAWTKCSPIQGPFVLDVQVPYVEHVSADDPLGAYGGRYYSRVRVESGAPILNSQL